MTTALALLTRAYRENNLIPVGSAPSTKELTEAIAVLNSYMLSQFTMAVGDQLMEWPIPRRQRDPSVTSREFPLLPGAQRSLTPTYSTLIPPNSRIIWDGSERRVWLTDKPKDGNLLAVAIGSGANADNAGTLTIDGNGRLIDGADTATFIRATFAASRWFYRADTAQWTPIEALAQADEMIFPEEFDDVWVCGVAVRLAPRYGKTISAATIARGSEVLLLLQTRYFQSQPTGSGGELLVPGFESFGNPSGANRWMR